MSGVLWSPVHHDKFILWGPDITLYEVSRIKEIEKKTTFTPISSTRGATVLASQSASGVRCVDISASPEQPEPLLALGYASGRVALTTLKQTYDPLGLVGREFTPRYPRLCNSVAWSHMETNMLAVAMEKHRSDHCILLWDVYQGSMLSDEAKATEAGSSSSATDTPRPLAEMGLSETAHCVTWANFSNRTLIASMNLKYIKIFDLRDLSNKAVSMATTRYCAGVCAEPCGGYQIASRGEGVACVWDARALQRPLLTMQHPRPLAQLQWCPTRRNLLVSLQRDSSTLRIHDIQQAHSDNKMNVSDSMMAAPAVEAEEEQFSRGPSVIERDVCVSSAPASPLVAFSWHPTHEGRLLAVCASGGLVDYTVCERVTVAWGGGGSLLWTGGGGSLRMMRDDFYAAIRDISFIMKKRAQTDYGLKPDLWQNADLADDDSLSGLWHFLALSKSLVEDGCIRNSPWKHPGVRTVLRSVGDGGYRSEIVPSLLPDLPNRRERGAHARAAAVRVGVGVGERAGRRGARRGRGHAVPRRRAGRLPAARARGAGRAGARARAGAARGGAGAGGAERRAAVARGAGRGRAGAAGRVPARAAALPGGVGAGAPAPPPARAAPPRPRRRAQRDGDASGGPRGVRVHLPVGRQAARVHPADVRRAVGAGRPVRDTAHRRESRGYSAAAALGGELGRRAVRGAGGRALPHARPAAGPARAQLAGQLPHDPGQLAAVVGAVRAGHVGVRRRGGRGVGRRRRAAPRVRGLHLLRQVRGRPARHAAPRGARPPAAPRRQDEANLVVSKLPQAAAAVRRVLAARGHGRGRGRGGRGRGGGRGAGRRLQRVVQLVRRLPARRTRAAPHQLVQGAHGVSGEFVQLSVRHAGPARPAVAAACRHTTPHCIYMYIPTIP